MGIRRARQLLQKAVTEGRVYKRPWKEGNALVYGANPDHKEPVLADAVKSAREGLARRRARISTAEFAQKVLNEIENRVRSGDLAKAAALLSQAAENGLTADQVSANHRDAVCTHRERLHADLAMQLGEPEAAIRYARRALAGDLGWVERAATMTVMGAAQRMRSVRGASAAVATYEEVMRIAHLHPGGEGRRALRHANAAITAPLVVRGAFSRAVSHAERALHLSIDRDEAAESHLVLCRAQYHLGQSDAARRNWEHAANANPDVPWLRKWLDRFEAVFASADMTPEHVDGALERALLGADGYGFQRDLILAQIASRREVIQPDRWSHAGLRALGCALGEEPSRDLLTCIEQVVPLRLRGERMWRT